LSDLEGFSYEEIAEILNLPMGTIRSRLFRARKILREHLKKYALSRGIKDKSSD
jgi:RNA polymerase sigma-70 factor (ECF subfamily)